MKIAIHQPQYFPWPPYVHKVVSADIFVYLDTVQFTKNGVQNRNRIKTPTGAQWLTLPVRHQFGASIRETSIADPGATGKHWKTVVNNYSRTPGFERWRDELANLFMSGSGSLSQVAMASTDWMLEKMQARTQRMRASDISAEGKASALVASICKALGATTYLTGTGALAYLEPADFENIGCEIQVQQWQPFTYSQVYPEIGFVPELSTLDLLLNCPDTAADLVAVAGTWSPHAKAS